jgi:hypothetical protein
LTAFMSGAWVRTISRIASGSSSCATSSRFNLACSAQGSQQGKVLSRRGQVGKGRLAYLGVAVPLLRAMHDCRTQGCLICKDGDKGCT